MMEKLPRGTSIGSMKASLPWVLTHTSRFAGIVIVTIQESHGFILIYLGKPLVYYFKHGANILKGHAAYQYFESQPVLNFELMRYSVEEMKTAIELTSDLTRPARPGSPEIPNLVQNGIPKITTTSPETDLPVNSLPSSGPQVPEPMNNEVITKSVENSVPVTDEIPEEPMGTEGITLGDYYEHYNPAPPPDPPDVGELILGQILDVPGVQAVTIFRKGLNVLSFGDFNAEDLINMAEDLIESAKELSFVMRTGHFIQVTLQVPVGNIIIAPYYEEYICILTSPEINLGQIRKIIRSLPAIEPHATNNEEP